MTYLPWAIYAEGMTDVEYLSSLIPRIISKRVMESDGPPATIPEAPVGVFGVGNRAFDAAAIAVCEAKDAFFILFVHSDTGSPALERTLADRTCALCERVCEMCQFERERCVIIAPRREIEAWCLADREAVRLALGLNAGFDLSDIPVDADAIERIPDPKQIASNIQIRASRGRRRGSQKFPYSVVAQIQSIDHLQRLPSFINFDRSLSAALRTLGYPRMR